MIKTSTNCCALCQLSGINNMTPKDEIKQAITILKKEKDENTDVGISYGDGQTATFVIVSPGEEILANNLKELGFQHKHTFERRKGYPDGMLGMWIKNL